LGGAAGYNRGVSAALVVSSHRINLFYYCFTLQKKLIMARNFEIYANGERVTITAETNGEARAYACGILEGMRRMGRTATDLQVYNDCGKLIFSH
jgi:hypothetical protein